MKFKRQFKRLFSASAAAIMAASALMPMTEGALNVSATAVSQTVQDEVQAPEPIYQDTVQPGTYSIQNAKGFFMTNEPETKLGKGHPVNVQLNEGLSTQLFELKYIGQGAYTIAAGDDTDFFLNCTCSTANDVREGIDISTWEECDDGTQYFYFTEVSEEHELHGGYYIQSMINPELVVAPQSDNTIGSKLVLQKYDPQNNSQIWNIVKPSMPALEEKQNIAPGDYSIINAGNGFGMTNRKDRAVDKGHAIELDMNETLPSQRFTLKYVADGKYALAVGDEKNRYVNCKVSTPDKIQAGVPICSWDEYKDGTQYFYFSSVGDGQYIIRSSVKKNLVIAASSKNIYSSLELQEYSGSALQRWKLNKLPEIQATTAATVTTAKTTSTTVKATSAKATSTAAKATTVSAKTTSAKVTETTIKQIIAYPKPLSVMNVAQGEYGFQNAGNGYYMTNQPEIALDKGHPMSIEMNEVLPSQVIVVNYLGDGKYTLALGDDPSYFVDCTCAKPENIRAGIDISSWKAVNDSRQQFYITPVGSDEYVIQSAQFPELVIAPAYDQVGSKLILQTFDARNATQRWKLHLYAAVTTAPVTTVTNKTTTTTKATQPTTTTTVENTTAKVTQPTMTTAVETTTAKVTQPTTTTAVETTTAKATQSTNTKAVWTTTTKATQPTTTVENTTAKATQSTNTKAVWTTTTKATQPTTTTETAVTTVKNQAETTSVSITTGTTAVPVNTTGATETTAASAETTPVQSEAMTGDPDGDGEVSVEDAQITLMEYVNTLAGLSGSFTARQKAAADIDGDGKITAADAQLILMYYVNNKLAGNAVTWNELLGKTSRSPMFSQKKQKAVLSKD